jgi:hypothetical protein
MQDFFDGSVFGMTLKINVGIIVQNIDIVQNRIFYNKIYLYAEIKGLRRRNENE